MESERIISELLNLKKSLERRAGQEKRHIDRISSDYAMGRYQAYMEVYIDIDCLIERAKI